MLMFMSIAVEYIVYNVAHFFVTYNREYEYSVFVTARYILYYLNSYK